MKHINLRTLTAIAFLAMILSSCGLKKMTKKYETVKYEVTPNVLETHGGKISVTVKGTFPAKYFHKKATVDFAPILTYNGGSTPLKSVTLQGEKVKGGSGTVILKKAGGVFTYTDVITYDPKMNASELHVNPKASLKKKSVQLGDRKIADGVIYTSERVTRDEDLTLAEHGYVKEVIVNQSGVIYYDYNKSDVNLKTQALNKEQANADALKAFVDFLAKQWKVKNIDINAWASPEGEEDYNRDLSEKRGATGKQFIKDQYAKFIADANKKAGIKQTPKKVVDKNAKEEDPYNITVSAKGEDLDGFTKAIGNSNIAEKNAILNVVNSQSDMVKRQAEINKMAVIYKEVEDIILPPLRRSEMTVYCYEPKKTDEKIAMLSTTTPDSLDNKELLYAATLTQDLATQLKIYKSATTQFPEDWKGYNNAGYTLLKQNNPEEAKTYLDKANTLSPSNGIVLNNLGVVASWQKDYDNAKSFYEQAQSKGVAEGYNLGIIMIRKGEYANALTSFGSKTCTHNIALAQLLSGNASSAATTLECAKKDAAVYYLLAVVGARTSNTSLMYDNLKKACQADASYKAQAKEDREFLKYFTVSDFTNAIQ